MSGGVVCYVERELGGAMIRRVRLVAAGLSRSWTAPEAQTISGQPSSGPGAALANTKIAATWIAETVQSVGLKRVAWVCLDAEGSVCAWLSAPSPEQSVIEASIAQAAQDSGTGDGAGLGAGRLLAMASPSGVAGLSALPDTSVQALATLEEAEEDAQAAEQARAKGGAGKGKKSKASTLSKKHRYAVLAVPDAPVRVLLDELDNMGIEVEGVCSLWHAMARAWGEAPGRGGGLEQSGDTRAIVLCEPAGRVVWAWSRDGELLAGGTMRLAQYARPAAVETMEQGADGTRRMSAEQISPPLLQFTRGEAGRLVMDWMAWSVQLGASPRRVICLATPTLTDGAGEGATEGAGVLGRTLAAQWGGGGVGGATVDAGTYDDPVAATLSRLAGLGTEQEAASAMSAATSESARSAMVPLSSRPGRADRAMFTWAAAGILMGAITVGALGWQLGQAAHVARGAAQAAGAQRVEELRKLETTLQIPNLSTDPKPVETLNGRISKLREDGRKVRAPRPVLEEIARLMKSLDGIEDVRLTEFECNAMFNAKAELVVPDAETGPEVLEKLRSIPGQLVWTGSVPASFGGPTQRKYVLLGLWPQEGGTP